MPISSTNEVVSPAGLRVRILILSDIHANPWALRAIEKDVGRVDYVLCAGDVVNYGPEPGACIAWLRERGAIVVRGNHDHAVAFHGDPRAAPAKAPLALAMRDWTRRQLSTDDLAWLARLPVRLTWRLDGLDFLLVHATPFDPLFDYHLTPQADPEQLDVLLAGAPSDIIVAGHTHLPLLRSHRRFEIINPGSAGQPLDGDFRAAYALWENGRTVLGRTAYDVSGISQAIDALPLRTAQRRQLQLAVCEGRL